MSEQTLIAWCDSTVNFWEGCTKVSEGCKNCYAEARDKRHMFGPVDHWGKDAPRRKSMSAAGLARRLNARPWICDDCGGQHMAIIENKGQTDDLGQPARARYCQECGSLLLHRRRIFTNSLSDWLDEEPPIEWLAALLDTIRQCDQVTWILCTKRPENFGPLFDTLRRLNVKFTGPATREWIDRWYSGVVVPHHVIVLASVENQAMADKRIPELVRIPAVRRGLSLEPLLGPVNLESALGCSCGGLTLPPGGGVVRDIVCELHHLFVKPKLDWLIIGGESGPNARPCNVEWARDLVRQGKSAGVPVFVKQLGSNSDVGKILPVECPKCHCVSSQEPGDRCIRDHHGCDGIMKEQKIKDKKGSDPSEWPEDLRVREWPV